MAKKKESPAPQNVDLESTKADEIRARQLAAAAAQAGKAEDDEEVNS